MGVLGMHDQSRISGDPVVVHPDAAALAVDRNFRDAGGQGVVVVGERDAERAILRPHLAPLRHLGRSAQHGIGARLVLGELQTQRERVLA